MNILIFVLGVIGGIACGVIGYKIAISRVMDELAKIASNVDIDKESAEYILGCLHIIVLMQSRFERW